MTSRMTRVNRLISVRAQVLDQSRAASARAEQAASAAKDARDAVESERGLLAATEPAVAAIGDLEAHRATLASLHRATEAAAQVVARLAAAHDEARETVVHSLREVRKLELFRAGVEQGESEVSLRTARREEDELAARKRRSSRP